MCTYIHICIYNTYVFIHTHNIYMCTYVYVHIYMYLYIHRYVFVYFPVAQMVKNLPAMQETWVQFLGQEDPLEKEMTSHSCTLAWKIPRAEEPGKLQSMGLQRAAHNWATSHMALGFFLILYFFGFLVLDICFFPQVRKVFSHYLLE